eukprot:c4771_g1_i1.p1 GENE.c4771_g1_i1~~c4771_g1_i1.p1  ORF type:complete len:150 (+),score=13.26 c4771_g1_i1:492-941(+)
MGKWTGFVSPFASSDLTPLVRSELHSAAIGGDVKVLLQLLSTVSPGELEIFHFWIDVQSIRFCVDGFYKQYVRNLSFRHHLPTSLMTALLLDSAAPCCVEKSLFCLFDFGGVRCRSFHSSVFIHYFCNCSLILVCSLVSSALARFGFSI